MEGVRPIEQGAQAPGIRGVDFGAGPTAVVFYKVTCPVCQMVAPKVAALHDAFPGRVIGVGQDPVSELESFASEFGFGAPSTSDTDPYPISDSYGIEAVPTLVLVGSDGVVADVVQSWNRDGYNHVGDELAELTGRPTQVVSDPDDGLPPFRPG